jgi:uncharacterized membrane protein
VLLLDGDSSDNGSAQPLIETLKKHGITVDQHCDAAAFPRSPIDLMPFDAVILLDVPRLDDAQDATLATYVRDLGGSLVMIGGPHAFGAGGWAGSQLEQVLPVNCQPPKDADTPPASMVILIDRSASMGEHFGLSSRTKQDAANEAAAAALRSLRPSDRVGIVAFDSAPTWISPLSTNADPAATARAIRRITPGGNTAIAPAIAAACDALEHCVGNSRRILLLTDGGDNSPGEYLATVARLHAAGITLTTIGIGNDADQRLLRFLAWAGHGNFYPVTNPELLPQLLAKEAMALHESLVRDRPFTPRIVESSPLIAEELAELPPLRGSVTVWPKRLPGVRVPIVASDDGAPVLAQRRVGLGQTVAFMSDASDHRWAAEWTKSPMFDRFWNQAIHAVERPAGTRVSASIVAVSPTRAKLVVEASSVEIHGDFTASIVGPDASQPARSIRLVQTAAATFEGDFATPDLGAYLAVVKLDDRAASAPYVAQTSAELSDLQSNDAAVRQIAARTGGRVLSPAFDPRADLFNRADLRPSPPVSLPLTDKLILLAVFTLLLDVGVRRIVWDKHTFAHAWGVLGQTVRSFTQVRVGDPEFSLGALMFVHLERQRDLKPAEVPPIAESEGEGSIAIAIAQHPAEIQPVHPHTSTPPQPGVRTLDALLYSHRQRSGR